MHTLTVSLLLAAVATAQQSPASQRIPQEPSMAPGAPVEIAIPESTLPASAPQVTAPRQGAMRDAPMIGMPAAVLFDAPAPGQLWAGAPTWKAGFDGMGATFVPCFGSEAPRNFPARFAVAEVRLAGEPQAFVSGAPRLDGEVVSIDRGVMVEEYVTSLAGIEQRFVFERLPQRGELVVSIAVESELSPTASAVHTFSNAFGSFEYGAAFAFDARGRRTEVACDFVDGALRLSVPSQFVVTATLPLVIDPLIGNVITVGSSFVHHGEVDLAYDASRDEYLVCFERKFSSADSDVLGVRCNGSLQPLAAQFFIDSTTTSWRGCRTAGLDVNDKFLVVCECEQSGQPTYVAGRILDAATGGLGSAFDIERGAVACSSPDVGGDPFPVGPVFWTVVYERGQSGSNHDVVMRQVQSSGALRGSAFTPIGSTNDHEHSPVISKSDGADGSAATQRWCIAYRRDTNSFGTGQTTVRAATVRWDGVVDATQMVSGWFAAADNFDLAVSNPTMESLGRHFLIVENRVNAVGNEVIWGTVTGAGGAFVAGWQALIDPGNLRREPAVACDGARFGVAYTQLVGSADVHVSLLDRIGTQLVVHDSVMVTTAPTNDGTAALVAHASGGATSAGDRQFGMVWNAGGSTGDMVGAARYIGMAGVGGATMRSTGCGNLQVGFPAAAEFGALGTTIQVSVQNPVGIVGWGIGDVVTVPLPGCGSCIVGTSAIVLVAGPTAQVPVPYNGALVGLTFAFQAFSLGQGACLGSFEFSDTIDVRIR